MVNEDDGARAATAALEAIVGGVQRYEVAPRTPAELGPGPRSGIIDRGRLVALCESPEVAAELAGVANFSPKLVVAVEECSDCPCWDHERDACRHPVEPACLDAPSGGTPPTDCPLRRGPTLLKIFDGRPK